MVSELWLKFMLLLFKGEKINDMSYTTIFTDSTMITMRWLRIPWRWISLSFKRVFTDFNNDNKLSNIIMWLSFDSNWKQNSYVVHNI